jgi:hypothetical protein
MSISKDRVGGGWWKRAARVLLRWPCHPTLFLFHDFNTPNSIMILTFPFSNLLTNITQQEEKHKHNDDNYDNELVTLVTTILSTPIQILYERPSPRTNQSHVART